MWSLSGCGTATDDQLNRRQRVEREGEREKMFVNVRRGGINGRVLGDCV